MRAHTDLMKTEAIANSVGWYQDFFEWQDSVFWRGLDEHSERLAAHDDLQVRKAGEAIRVVLARKADGVRLGSLSELLSATASIGDLLSGLRDNINARLENSFRELLKANPTLLDELLVFLRGLEPSQEDAADDLEDADVEEDDVSLALKGKSEVRTMMFASSMFNTLRGLSSRLSSLLMWINSLMSSTSFSTSTSMLVLRALRRTWDLHAALRNFLPSLSQ